MSYEDFKRSINHSDADISSSHNTRNYTSSEEDEEMETEIKKYDTAESREEEVDELPKSITLSTIWQMFTELKKRNEDYEQ